jgi:hypothetical protein
MASSSSLITLSNQCEDISLYRRVSIVDMRILCIFKSDVHQDSPMPSQALATLNTPVLPRNV